MSIFSNTPHEKISIAEKKISKGGGVSAGSAEMTGIGSFHQAKKMALVKRHSPTPCPIYGLS